MEKNIEEFKELRNDFESITKKRYRKIFGKSGDNLKIYEIIDELANSKVKSVYNTNKDFIDFCRLKRNLLSHGNYEKEFSVYTDEFINAFKDLIEKAKPRTAYSMSIHNVVTYDVDSVIGDVLRKMSENDFTHMPITKDGRLVGMLSEASLIKYMAENDEVVLDLKRTFSKQMDLIDWKYSEGNVFFVGRNKDYDRVVNDFIDEYNKHQKISCILVTEKGNREEKILGILTARDIIGKD